MKLIIFEKIDLNAQATNFLSIGFEANWKNKQVEKFNKAFF